MSAAPDTAPRRSALIWWSLAGAVVVAGVLVALARLLRTLPAVQAFVAANPGAAPLLPGAPVGFPAWLAIQHGLNALFLFFVIRSGWRMHRAVRPTRFWTRRNDGRIRTANPPVRIAIDLGSHFVGDTLWVANGVLFLVLLFASGQWMRIVPTSWEVVPAALSALLQYVSLDWPTTDGWIDFNGLQSLSYFVVVFVASPVAVATGLRAAPGFAARLRGLDAHFPVRTAKRIHFWTMVFFVVFTAGHVFLVLATGALRNLNHLFAGNDGGSAAGLVVFAASIAVGALIVLATRPRLVRSVAARFGTVLERPARRPNPGP